MPMSPAFQARLQPHLPRIVREFGTPFHLYDEQGIIDTCQRMKTAFGRLPGYLNYFAVKALPNPRVLKLIHEQGFGFDCSSVPELNLAREAGARWHEIMFTSNNTSPEEFACAMAGDGCYINLDDVSLIRKVPEPFPSFVSFRYNPGKARTGNSIIGKPHEAKYGITTAQLIPAYREAIARGASGFGLHAMLCSNERRVAYMVETVKMLLDVCAMLEEKLAMYQMHLPQVRLGGVDRAARAVLDRGPGVGVALHPEPGDDSECPLGQLAETVLIAPV